MSPFSIEQDPRPSISQSDFGELVRSFNEITSQLERTHDTLRAEVAELKHELAEANERLRRSRSLAALGEMAAGIAHEIRNPLGAMALNLGVLREDLESMPDSLVLCDRLAGSVQGLDAIVGDVLSFARDTRVSTRCCEPLELINAALEANAPLVDRVGVRVEVDVRPGLSADVDPGPVTQALTNVVRNACEALETVPDRAPVLSIVVDRGLVRTTTDAGRVEHLRFLIRDNGPGIPDELKERIFNPFFTTRETGTGLGLAIVHRIVDAHGGTLTIEDATPGTAICLSFPTAADPVPSEHEASLAEAVRDRIQNHEPRRSTP
ncbi:MAG: ATP-binding protein [Planctomycetota bacterium]|nr:ATP-binding protein [Planctomycetota bacterium]MEC9157581.1 ATP-binding protein [Planctomycetota bacterium]MEC9232305.1 ATP-binding protein [Planctomycetota bacterium]